MEYVKSNKGGFKLLYNNYMYVKQKVLKNGAVCWECDQRRNKFACKTKLPVLDDQIIKVTNDHTHAVNRGEVQASKVRQEMKKRARETEETPQCYRRFISSHKKAVSSISAKQFLGKFSLWVCRSDTKMTKTSHTRFVGW